MKGETMEFLMMPRGSCDLPPPLTGFQLFPLTLLPETHLHTVPYHGPSHREQSLSETTWMLSLWQHLLSEEPLSSSVWAVCMGGVCFQISVKWSERAVHYSGFLHIPILLLQRLRSKRDDPLFVGWVLKKKHLLCSTPASEWLLIRVEQHSKVHFFL